MQSPKSLSKYTTKKRTSLSNTHSLVPLTTWLVPLSQVSKNDSRSQGSVALWVNASLRRISLGGWWFESPCFQFLWDNLTNRRMDHLKMKNEECREEIWRQLSRRISTPQPNYPVPQTNSQVSSWNYTLIFNFEEFNKIWLHLCQRC